MAGAIYSYFFFCYSQRRRRTDKYSEETISFSKVVRLLIVCFYGMYLCYVYMYVIMYVCKSSIIELLCGS